MTEQEIEKLREKLGSEYSVKRLNGAITVELVDIWKGVEFAECVDDHLLRGSIEKGKIYKTRTTDLVHCVGIEGKWGGFGKEYFKPSTESAYVEQLKAKAHELYGEIKDGDRFDLSMFGEAFACDILLSDKWDFAYDKRNDSLSLAGFLLYRQGRWAKKIERVRVVPSEIHYPKPYLDQYVTVELRVIGGLLDSTKSKGAIEELAKCLEDYLNKS